MPSNNNAYSITIRAHQNDVSIFEQYFAVLKVWLESYEEYSYSIEWDDTVNRHLHLYLISQDRDSNSLMNKLKKKGFKKILNNLNKTQTVLSNFIKIQKITNTPEDLIRVLGYVNKWHCRRRYAKNIEPQKIIDAVEYYSIQTHHEKLQIKDDVKIVTTKNIYAMIKQFTQDTQIPLTDPLIKLKMTQAKYGFINVSPKNISRAFKELKIMENSATEQDKEDINLELYGMEKDYDHYLHENIKEMCHFIQMCHSIDPDEIPANVSNLMKNYL